MWRRATDPSSELVSSSSSQYQRVKHVCFAVVHPEFCSHCRSEQQIQVSLSLWCSVDTSISVSGVFCLHQSVETCDCSQERTHQCPTSTKNQARHRQFHKNNLSITFVRCVRYAGRANTQTFSLLALKFCQ